MTPQRQCEQARLKEYEEKMIVTAWYNKVPWDLSFFLFVLRDLVSPSLLSKPSESELPEAGDGIPSGWLPPGRAHPVLPVPATSSG